MELTFLLLFLLLLIALPFLFLLPIYARGSRKADEQLASIKPLLLEWGFERASWFEQTRLRFLYKTTKQSHPIYLSLKTLNHGSGSKLLTFLVFTAEVPLSGHLFIRTADLEHEQNDILYEAYWKGIRSEALTPFGLYTLCETAHRSNLERCLLSEPAQRIFSGLVAQKDLFYIYGETEYGFLELGFALPRSPEPQRIRRWFDTAVGLAHILNAPNRQNQVKRKTQSTLFFLLLVFACILFLTLILFGFIPTLEGV